MDFYINALDYEEKYNKLLEDYEYLKGYYLNNVSKYEELIEKHFNLQRRIDNAIEYISNACYWLNIGFRDDDELLQVKAKFFKEISQILQGEDNE